MKKQSRTTSSSYRRRVQKKRRYPYLAAGHAASVFAGRHGAQGGHGGEKYTPGDIAVVKVFGLYTMEWGAYYQGYLDGYSARCKERKERK